MNKKSSADKQADKFAGMLQGAQSIQRPSNLTADEPTPAQPILAAKKAREMGRSHPANKSNFASTTVYLDRSIHKRVKAALLEDEEDLSVRVEKLLTEWLESRNL